MPILYLDNYRGFQKTFLPLKSVNFFVGENSTGKTSILKLIKLLSSSQFWFDLQFDNDEIELGFYSEIVSKNSDNDSYFEVGLVGDIIDKKSRVSAINLKFKEDKGIPKVSEIRMIDRGKDVVVKISKNKISYSIIDIDIDNVDEKNKNQYFKIWIDRIEKSHKSFKELEIPTEGFPIIFYIKTLVSEEIQSNGSKEKNYPPGLNLPNFLNELAWLAPIRAEPQRTYDKHKISFSPDGTHTPYILKDLLSDNSNKSEKIERILNRFGQDSGLYKKIQPTSLKNDSTAPFEIHVYLDKKPIKISNVGYGVSQIMPLIIEIIRRENGSWFAIQQPEIHLHPRGQAAFGDFIFKSFIKENKNFIIETHSDFTIDRFRLRVKKEYEKKRKEREIFQVVFFERSEGYNQLSTIMINNDGSYSDQPKKFKEFFIKEQLDLIEL